MNSRLAPQLLGRLGSSPSITGTVLASPESRIKVIRTVSPGFFVATTSWSCCAVVTLTSSIFVITSPFCRPAVAAGPPGITLEIPTATGVPLWSVTVVTETPSAARRELTTRPLSMIWRARSVAMSLGMAKPIPGADPSGDELVVTHDDPDRSFV